MRQHCLLKLAACSTLSHHTTDRHCMEGFTGAGVRPAELSGLSTVLLQWPLAAVQRTNILAAVLRCIDRQYLLDRPSASSACRRADHEPGTPLLAALC